MTLTKKQKTWVDKINEVLGKVKKLPTAASMPGFDKLKPAVQGMVLETLAARPDDAALAKSVRDLLGGSNFKGFPEPRQTSVLKLIQKLGGGSKKIANLVTLIDGIIAFDIYPEEVQKMVLEVFASRPQDASLAQNISAAVQHLQFGGLDPFVQNNVLLRIRDMSADSVTTDNLVRVVAWTDFDSIDVTVQNEILDNLPNRYQGALTPKMIKNVVFLATAGGFGKLNVKVRELLFNQLSAKPENENLATAFHDLVETGALFDTRTAQGKIIDADDKNP